MPKDSLQMALSEFMAMRSESSEWLNEAKEVSEFLIPGRGMYNFLSTPRNRKLTSPKVVNTTGKEALKVLTSGIQGGLTSPSKPWLALSWQNKDVQKIKPLVDWLDDSKRRLEYALQQSNFYPTMHTFYTEYSGFGVASMYVGADSDISPFRFELLTAGEYSYSLNSVGRADKIYRQIYMTPRQMEQKFGRDNLSKATQEILKSKSPDREKMYVSVLECVYAEKYKNKPFTQVFWEIGGAPTSFSNAGIGNTYAGVKGTEKPLMVRGFEEFPYPVARWDVIGNDVNGLGPGNEALPEIKRLQEMSKAFMMGVHKDADPPLNVPAYMRGRVKSLPGAYNYYRNPNETINSLYTHQMNFAGIAGAIEQVEERIKKIFYNDIFLSAARDPNLSPLKAAEVYSRDGDRMLRLGPVIERLQNEFIEPVIERCFNIMLRKGLFSPLPDDLAQMAGDYKIDLVSPLAQAQKLTSSKSIDSVMAFAGNAAAIEPSVMDKFDIDAAVDEVVDAHGAPRTILRTDEEVQQIRQNRAKQQAAQEEQASQLQQAELAARGTEAADNSAKTRAETAQIVTESMLEQRNLSGVIQ